jgi:hypothetical protein
MRSSFGPVGHEDGVAGIAEGVVHGDGAEAGVGEYLEGALLAPMRWADAGAAVSQ